MRDSGVIDQIYGQILQLSGDDSYSFGLLKGQWGYKSGEQYQKNLLLMMKNIRQLAKETPVLYYDYSFWLFDGKIYAPIREELVVEAFYMLIEHLEIMPAIRSKVFSDAYVKNIRYYNPMVQSRNLIAFENGVLDISPILKGHKPIFHEDFSPRYHVTYYHPYKYDENARCLKWMNFLHEVLPDKNSRVILQMFLGLGLIDSSEIYLPYEGKDAARVELCLLMIGPGGNGKSVVYRTARGIYGSERISELNYEALTSGGDEGMRNRLLLRGKIFNWNSDEDSRIFGKKNSATFKKIVSGETVTERRIGGNVTFNDNLPYLVFHLNELPYPDDQSLGFIRRLQFISFDVTIPKERRNPHLAQDMIPNYPGIFNWVVRGARDIIRRKFIFPSSEGHRRQLLLTQLKSSPVLAWINAYGVRYAPQANQENCDWVRTDDIVASIEAFCEANDAEIPSRQKIGHTLGKFGFSKRKKSYGNEYQIFGCNAERMSRPFIIADEDLSIEYEEEKGSFILEDD